MRIDNLEQFVKLRRELTQEKEQLSRRLAQINEALGEISETSTAEASEPAPTLERAPLAKRRTGPVGRPTSGGTSLRQLVLDVLREGPKTKEEVLDAVQSRGYKFSTNNPLNSLGVILYGKSPKFERLDGKFALPGGRAATGGGSRQMSAAGRERIAEAQRQRWAATRKGQGGSNESARQSNGVSHSGKRTLSPAARKAIAAAARKRWAAAKAAGKNRL
jgi:hypothetical protein